MCENTNAVLSSRWPEDKVKCFGYFSRSKRFPFLLHSPVVTSYATVFFYVFVNTYGVYEFDPTFHRTTFLLLYVTAVTAEYEASTSTADDLCPLLTITVMFAAFFAGIALHAPSLKHFAKH
jgi:hypothetical protein